jgi:hypothetical protein
MGADPVDPEHCLRSLAAEALRWAYPDRPLFPVSLGLMGVANAFVMLGLLPESQAEAILADLGGRWSARVSGTSGGHEG